MELIEESTPSKKERVLCTITIYDYYVMYRNFCFESS